MNFTLTRIGSVVFVRLSGTLGAGIDFGSLQTAVTQVFDPGVRGIFLDFGRVAQLDCTGIGEIVRLRRMVGSAGRAFGLVNVSERHRKMLDMVHLTPLLGGKSATAGPAASRSADTRSLPGIPRHFYSVIDTLVSDTGTAFRLV